MELSSDEYQRLVHRSHLMDLAQDILIVLHPDGRIEDVNQAAADMHGVAVEELRGRNCAEFLHEDSSAEMYRIASRMVGCREACTDRMSVRAYRHDESLVDLELRVSWSPEHGRFYVVERDVSAEVARRRELEELTTELAKQAMTDTLTGVGNRAAFDEAMQLAEARDDGSFLVLVDVDKFKAINDTYGHGVGDAVLKEIAQRLLDTVTSDDTVTRIGGDEFMVIVHRSTNVDFEDWLSQMCDALMQPHQLAERPLTVSCSFGATKRGPGESTAQWTRRTDHAMYEAKADARRELQAT